MSSYIDEMYNIVFYSTADGTSELRDFLINLRKKSLTNKDARIQHKQIAQYIQLLEDHGTYLGEKITKHSFRKRTQKTPRNEIEKAKRERDDWLTREG